MTYQGAEFADTSDEGPAFSAGQVASRWPGRCWTTGCASPSDTTQLLCDAVPAEVLGEDPSDNGPVTGSGSSW